MSTGSAMMPEHFCLVRSLRVPHFRHVQYLAAIRAPPGRRRPGRGDAAVRAALARQTPRSFPSDMSSRADVAAERVVDRLHALRAVREGFGVLRDTDHFVLPFAFRVVLGRDGLAAAGATADEQLEGGAPG